MKVLFLTPHPIEGASSRFRVYQFVPYLQSRGIDCYIRPFLSSDVYLRRVLGRSSFVENSAWLVGGFVRRIRDVQFATKCDVVFIHREAFPYGPPVFEKMLNALGCKVCLDFDDALFLPAPSASSTPLLSWMKSPSRLGVTLKLSAHSMAGNSFLADYARRYCQNVSVIPTVIDTQKYRPRPLGSGNQEIVIGWMGSPSTVPYLKRLRDPLVELSKRHGIRFQVVGAKLPEEWHLPACCKNFDLAREVADLWSFDIGVMPQPDDPWSQGKCALKALQYMGVGIPAVCSPVGVVKGIIRDGQNGMLATSDGEWFEKLEALITCSKLRNEIGDRGREYVVKYLSVEAVLGDFCGVLESLASNGRREAVHHVASL